MSMKRIKGAILLLCCSAAADLLAQTRFSAAPLTELGSRTYQGFTGGLYENGANIPSSDHLAAGLAAAGNIKPLDASGLPSAQGKIVMISVGMSNTTQEFCAQNSLGPCAPWTFAGQAATDPDVNKTTLVIVNGASGGQTADTWDSPNDSNYTRVRDQNLTRAGVTEKQVQVAWLKVANARPTISLPAENADAYQLVKQMGDIARAMKVRYPNLGLVYVSSRIYAGYATTNLNPEPYAYESGFSVKLLVEAQIDQMRRGNVDSRAGNLDYRNGLAPWLAWGPYLWANGGIPRAGDGLTWQSSDLAADGTHPSQSGQQKVGTLLLQFFKNDVTARPWFLRPAERRRGVRRGAG